LEEQRTKLENLDIIGLVRGMGLTPDQLAALLQSAPRPETPARKEVSGDETV